LDKFNDGNTLPGSLGHFFVVLTLIAAIVASFSYFKSFYAKNELDAAQWKKLARLSVYIETVAVVGIVICLYYILYNHMYQYKFAYKHSDNALPVKYLFSCFWEGQEGSFILWIFWHCFLSICVMHSAKSWEAPVMAIIQFVQIFFCAFLLGIFFGDFHIGSSPFVLLRNSDMGIGPIFQLPDYLSKITDGRGLNKTLQDPWMVIHPPTLFYGFASCTIPMAFAIAGILKKDVTGWVKPALPWTIMAATVLGVGILMGAKWAYQSLSFGGYWAWDPVENASLVPWLIIIAGLHTMLIYKHTGYSLRASYMFIVLTFVFIVYSTCLTRTGILGETSVHSFTGTGIVAQLWLLLAFVCIPPLFLLLKNYKKIPTIIKEENTSSKEFWMFIGAMIFGFSALFVIAVTSLPVFNKLFGTHAALGEKSQRLYNNVHVPVVIIVGIILSIAQFLKYKKTDKKYWNKKLLWPILISIAMTILFIFTTSITYTKEGEVYRGLIILAVACSFFIIITNFFYLNLVKKNSKNWGSSLSHIGFGLLLVGILISSANQRIVSMNNPAVNVFDADDPNNDPRENLNLYKGEPTVMGKYKVTYVSDTADKISKDRQYYTVNFEDTITHKKFNLYPNAYLNVMNNGKAGIQPNPDFKNYWNKDLFLYITSLLDPSKRDEPAKFVQKPMKMGDTAFLVGGFLVLKDREILGSDKNMMGFKLKVEVNYPNQPKYYAYPKYIVKNNIAESVTDSVVGKNIQFRIDGIADNNNINFSVKDDNKLTDYITIKVLEFPHIKLMWIGLCVMSIGMMWSMWNRIRGNGKEKF
jgi:cytochrome c-type biogenesis protein CcmF